MKKENKIIFLVCITIVINCLIVIFFSTEIRKRLEVTSDQSEKMVQEVDKENAVKSEDSKKTNKKSSQDKESEDVKVTDQDTDKITSKATDSDANKDNEINEEDQKTDKDKDKDDLSVNKNAEVSTKSNKSKEQNIANNDIKYPDLQSKMNELKEENNDVVGYIWIEDSNISYPVLQGDTNEYYLHRDIDKKYSTSGSLVLDSALDKDKVGSLENALVIGKNISDGTMFADVTQYKEEDFYEKHSYIYYQDNEKLTKWKVFSVYYINGDAEEIPTTFKNNSSFYEYVLKIQKRSLYGSEITLNKEDSILTLMTDSFEYANGKTIVHAVLDEKME
jgi:sortase B